MTYQPPQPQQPWQPGGQSQYGPPSAPVSGPGGGYLPTSQSPGAPPPKKSKVGLVLGIVGGVLALCCVGGVLAVALAGNSKPAAVSKGKQSANPVASGSAAKSTTAAAAPKASGLNQPVRDGKFEFTVTSIKCGISRVGDSYLNKTAQGQFCEVNVTVKNIGTQPQLFDGSNQIAYGPNNVMYENDGEAELYANSDTQTFLNEINPGNSVNGVLVFDIPKDAKITKLELHDSAFSGGVTVQVG